MGDGRNYTGTCPVCQKQFRSKNTEQRCCSRACAMQLWYTPTCEKCGREFITPSPDKTVCTPCTQRERLDKAKAARHAANPDIKSTTCDLTCEHFELCSARVFDADFNLPCMTPEPIMFWERRAAGMDWHSVHPDRQSWASDDDGDEYTIAARRQAGTTRRDRKSSRRSNRATSQFRDAP